MLARENINSNLLVQKSNEYVTLVVFLFQQQQKMDNSSLILTTVLNILK